MPLNPTHWSSSLSIYIFLSWTVKSIFLMTSSLDHLSLVSMPSSPLTHFFIISIIFPKIQPVASFHFQFRNSLRSSQIINYKREVLLHPQIIISISAGHSKMKIKNPNKIWTQSGLFLERGLNIKSLQTVAGREAFRIAVIKRGDCV